MKWAIRIRFLTDRWHQKTTKWYSNSGDAWKDADRFQASHKNILESACALMHKE